MKKYKCLFNHELLILATSQTPYQSYDEDIKEEQVRGYVNELKDTDVDVIMCCPTAWRRNLWHSEIDPHWQEEAPHIAEPLPEHDRKYYEKAYFRLRRYMLSGADPVGGTLKAAREAGKDFFISYRMNDHHYLCHEASPMHQRFWKDNPQYRLPKTQTIAGQSGMFDYKHKEVRDFYFSLLEELTRLYDIDGIELDFLRSAVYFRPEEIQAGTPIMTEFVRSVKDMLEDYGKARGKKLQLCVRVPHTVEMCRAIGLDVEKWDGDGIVDMINISTHFIMSLCPDIEGFRSRIKKARLYGEMHFVVKLGQMESGFSNNVSRKTSREIYTTNAFEYLSRGCDGVSFFNFNYTRDHHFNEVRREGFMGCEPPFDVLRGISDKNELANQPRHYFVDPYYCELPQERNARVSIFVSGVGEGFKRAIMRVETKERAVGIEMQAFSDGVRLKEIMWMGELFPPLTAEVVPDLKHVRFFEVPIELIKNGENVFEVTAEGKLTFICMELAMYNNCLE